MCDTQNWMVNMRYALHQLFHQQVTKTPFRTAIICEDSTKTTYSELNSIANFYCNLLKNISSIKPSGNVLVGILSHVNISGIAAILGILKSGGAYVPIDTQYSSIQLEQVIKNTGMTILLADRMMADKYHSVLASIDDLITIVFDDNKICEIDFIHAGEFVELPNIKEMYYDKNCVETINQPSDNLAYVLHTSGSTGNPKGIMLSHRNAIAFVDWMQKEFKLTENDRVISRSPFKFDLSVFDIFNTLNVGASIICFDWNRDREKHSKHRDFVTLLEKERASIIYTTPSTLITLLERGGLFSKPTSLRSIMYAGEPFPIVKLRKIKDASPVVKIANIYGPTETNIITYHWVTDSDFSLGSIPLGKTVDDTEIIIVADDMKTICEPNDIGEIWCRGGTVTLGYLNQPELTKKCLIDSPFHIYPARYWRTGDLGYRDDYGILHYKGRRDHIYKINGYRIEIGEVEEAVAKLPGIFESCVVVATDTDEKKYLICHYALCEGASLSPKDARENLELYLQPYKIPRYFIEHNELPKTSSGKVDRVSMQLMPVSIPIENNQ